ncbi:hypothetical protein bthur0009_21810 [Bacillus thuringiensis serovar andalousiensis BGSC 4AW1]|nr:hypothetical protein bthur0009_21810 [Bacillus thuringiensis serovar andalousiensis BGSC 4AW1]
MTLYDAMKVVRTMLSVGRGGDNFKGLPIATNGRNLFEKVLL